MWVMKPRPLGPHQIARHLAGHLLRYRTPWYRPSEGRSAPPRPDYVCGSWIDAHGRRGCVCMCVLLWALTDSAVHVLMFSSCFTANFGFHNGVIGELLIQNSISMCYPANRNTFIR